MYYFAYGSLVNRERLIELSPSAAPDRVARIPHHALCFTGRSQAWGGGTATIGLAPNCDLWGALYEIDDAGRAAVERSGGSDGYVWAFTAVEDESGERIRAGILIKVRDFQRSDPSEAYLEVLKNGWRQWGLDPESILQHAPLTI
jgi:hypothetical protein